MTTKITEKNISSLANAGVQWQSVVVADGSTGLTAVAGRGYFINTTSGAITITLPTSANVGDVIVFKDYARTWATNNVTLASTLFDGGTVTNTFSTNGQTVTLVRMDDTKGWSLVNEDTTSNLFPAVFISATGGTVTTSGDYKIHTFTGDGCFVVSTIGNSPINPLGGPTAVDYLVVAGGGGADDTSGGGAGGFRESYNPTTSGSYTASPLATPTSLTITATTYPVTVGGGGSSANPGTISNGSNSVFSTITSTGGGKASHNGNGSPGGSGGGAGYGTGPCVPYVGGTGNTPPVSPPQGNPGGNSPTLLANPYRGAAGGGATAAGGNQPGGVGGAGAGTGINPSPLVGTPGPSPTIRYFAGGGGGAGTDNAGGPGGVGGGGASGSAPGQDQVNGVSGTANTGGGGGSASGLPSRGTSGAGGKGIVIIRYKFQ